MDFSFKLFSHLFVQGRRSVRQSYTIANLANSILCIEWEWEWKSSESIKMFDLLISHLKLGSEWVFFCCFPHQCSKHINSMDLIIAKLCLENFALHKKLLISHDCFSWKYVAFYYNDMLFDLWLGSFFYFSFLNILYLHCSKCMLVKVLTIISYNIVSFLLSFIFFL